MADVGMNCCAPVPEHVPLCRCASVSLTCSIITIALSLLGMMSFMFKAPVLGMGLCFLVGGLVMSVASCAFMCGTPPNKGKTVLLGGSAVTLVLACIGILLIFTPGNVCKEIQCYGRLADTDSCAPCVGDSCKAEKGKFTAQRIYVDVDEGEEGKSVLCLPKEAIDTKECGKMYCSTMDDNCDKDVKDKDGFQGGTWSFEDDMECNDWAYDAFNNLEFGFLLMFIFFPVLFLTACITAILAFRTPAVEEKAKDDVHQNV